MAILFFVGLFLMMIFMAAIDKRFGNFMGMVFVLGIVGFAIVAILCIAGWFIIPILLSIAVPVFLVWFVYWLAVELFTPSEQQRVSKNKAKETPAIAPKFKLYKPFSNAGN